MPPSPSRPDGGSSQRVDYLVERPAGAGLPEVIRILDHDDDNNLPIYISSDEEEEGEVEVGIVGAGGGEDVPPLSSDEEDEVAEDDQQSESDEEEDEDTDDSDAWSDWSEWSYTSSEDSGYGSLSEAEEELEDEDIRRRSPLVQQLPPDEFWQRLREDFPLLPAGPPFLPAGPPLPAGAPVPAVAPLPAPVAGPPVPDAAPVAIPQQLTARHPPVPVQHHELPGTSASQQPEESAPSTSGLSSSMKRSREDDWEETTAKRPKRNCEEGTDNSEPSTSSGSSSSRFRRYWEHPFRVPWAEDSDSD